MRARLAVVVAHVGVIVGLTSVTMGAHHAWTSEFSEDKPVVLRGTLTKVELVNPHGWLWLDVKNPDGTVTNWGVEGGAPNGLIRNGITKNSLKIGEEIIVHGYSRQGRVEPGGRGELYARRRREGVFSRLRRARSSGKGPRELQVRTIEA